MPRVLMRVAAAWLAVCGTGDGAQVFVSPDGEDAAPGTCGAPFATLARALDSLAGGEGGVVRMRGGCYWLDEPVKLDARHDGIRVEAECADDEGLALGLNVSGKVLDFGPLATDGAFRLLHPKRGAWQLFAEKPAWQLIPLPGSKPFRAEIRLAAFGEEKAQVKTIEKVDPFDAAAKDPLWIQDGDVLHLECDGRSFAYRIAFE